VVAFGSVVCVCMCVLGVGCSPTHAVVVAHPVHLYMWREEEEGEGEILPGEEGSLELVTQQEIQSSRKIRPPFHESSIFSVFVVNFA